MGRRPPREHGNDSRGRSIPKLCRVSVPFQVFRLVRGEAPALPLCPRVMYTRPFARKVPFVSTFLLTVCHVPGGAQIESRESTIKEVSNAPSPCGYDVLNIVTKKGPRPSWGLIVLPVFSFLSFFFILGGGGLRSRQRQSGSDFEQTIHPSESGRQPNQIPRYDTSHP